ncbi:MAG: hypothetical protein KFF73_05810 [Cyclobacteriaceae bacterium]|nr:hypothetical protein [Cyclobacteriaceae bacterium]
MSKNEKFDQIVLQLEKLYDVIELKVRHDYDQSVFYRIEDRITGKIAF